jgi:hypothetical protein
MEKGKKAQVTLFVILGLVLIVGIAGFFIFREVYSSNIPKNLEPAYNYYLSCIEEKNKRRVKSIRAAGRVYLFRGTSF